MTIPPPPGKLIIAVPSQSPRQQAADFCIFVCVQIFWCDTQIGGFPPINTDKTQRNFEKKSVIKSADFFGPEKSADFLVGGEIVWWDTSFKGHGALSNLRKGHFTVFFKGRGPS